MRNSSRIAVAILSGLLALGGCGTSQTNGESPAYPLPRTGPQPEFGDWFVFNPDDVAEFDINNVGTYLGFRVADSDYLLGTNKRVPAGTPLVYALNDRLVLQFYGSSTPECQPRIKDAAVASSNQLSLTLDDLAVQGKPCDGDLAPKAFDLFPINYPDIEFWHDPIQVSDWLRHLARDEPVLKWTSKMDYSESSDGIATEFGTFVLADSISHKGLAEDYGGDTSILTNTEGQDVDAVSDLDGHIVCRYGQPCVSVDEFGNETLLPVPDSYWETPPATE